MSFRELQAAQQLDGSRQQGSGNYLKKRYRIKACQDTRTQIKAPGGFKKLTLQLLTCGLKNSNKKRVALFEMSNLHHQVRHLTFKRRHLLYQAEISPCLIYRSFHLALQQRQSTFKIRNPRQVLSTAARRAGSRWNSRIRPNSGRRVTVKNQRSTTIIRLEENKQGKITQRRTMLEVAIHSTKYLQNYRVS
jgi:hypothetical protein